MGAPVPVIQIVPSAGSEPLPGLAPGWSFARVVEPPEPATLDAWLRRQPPPVAALLGPNLRHAIRTARQVHAASPLCQLIFLTDENGARALEETLRAFVLVEAHWVMMRTNHPRWSEEVAHQVSIGERRRRHRSTLDRVNLGPRAAVPLDALAVQRLAVSERFQAAMIEYSADAVVALAPNRQIVSWNPSAEAMWQVPATEAMGQTLEGFFDQPSREEFIRIVDSVSQDRMFGRSDLTGRTPHGVKLPLEVTIAPALDRDRHLIGFSVIARDITERRAAQSALEEARDKAVASSRAKDDFLAALSHELRTPLNPVLLISSEAADNPAFPPEVRREFATIRDNVQLEARLIDDLLDLTRITRGKLVLAMEPVDVHTVLRDAVAIVRSEAVDKRIKLTLELGARHAGLRGDSVRLQQVFWNVIKNAVKFTPEGGRIVIDTRNPESDHRLVVRVTDTGIGLNPAELGRIFNAFEQGDHAAAGSHRFGGLGLGLAISQMLVRLHEGEIRASSEGPQRGSVFEVDLPLVPAPRPEATVNSLPPAPTVPDLAPAGAQRILLVEDHLATRLALKRLLTKRNFSVADAGTLADARRLAAEGGITLLLSDVGLPDGNGYELMADLRARYGLQGIAMTGYGAPDDLMRSSAAGFAEHLTKPVTIEALDKALGRLVPSALKPRHG